MTEATTRRVRTLFDCVGKTAGPRILAGINCEDSIIELEWQRPTIDRVVYVNCYDRFATVPLYDALTRRQRFLLWWVTWCDRRLPR